jgi:hypothetical protein
MESHPFKDEGWGTRPLDRSMSANALMAPIDPPTFRVMQKKSRR